ncbi:MBL fold metallo-hydrolase [Natronincola ferrireducens]|uniref:RNAse Z n=1 Tax=Natronincola ferrireducens TaxID=393762 RepID=A0A1G8Z9B0_9FIRM|nr:MBL fold metallo-hydrolase [Natronincola ferrireducens]SDK11679.1 RNAse Z [Natronincola ferrireducens]
MENQTKVVLLGTGTPNPVPERSGPCVAIVVGENSYLVDFGPGVVRQAEKANRKGIKALEAKNLKRAFLTHLHSDHTAGYSDLILTPWVLEREEPLKVFGPKGIKQMTNHLLEAYKVDIDARRYGGEKANETGIKVDVEEVFEGIIYSDEKVIVEAFRVNHPPFEAYGYKFITPDKVVVVSGDTTPCENLIKHAKGCNILVHEVYSATGINSRTPKWYNYHTTVHTSSVELGEIASQVNPELLVLYHQLFMVGENESGEMLSIAEREQEMIMEIKQKFDGEVISAKDLDIF